KLLAILLPLIDVPAMAFVSLGRFPDTSVEASVAGTLPPDGLIEPVPVPRVMRPPLAIGTQLSIRARLFASSVSQRRRAKLMNVKPFENSWHMQKSMPQSLMVFCSIRLIGLPGIYSTTSNWNDSNQNTNSRLFPSHSRPTVIPLVG